MITEVPHDLRHIFATLAIQAEINILNFSRQLRHASFAITDDVYAHTVPSGNRTAADVTVAIVAGNHVRPARNGNPGTPYLFSSLRQGRFCRGAAIRAAPSPQ